MAALDFGGTLANVKTMLSGVAAWQTICGVSTSALAAERIYLGGLAEDVDDESPCPCAVINIGDQGSPVEWNRSTALAVEIVFQLPMPDEEQQNESDQWIWIWSKHSALVAGIHAAVGGSGQLQHTATTTVVKPGPINPDENQGRNEWTFTLSLTVRVV